jgi:hypothetical protein
MAIKPLKIKGFGPISVRMFSAFPGAKKAGPIARVFSWNGVVPAAFLPWEIIAILRARIPDDSGA